MTIPTLEEIRECAEYNAQLQLAGLQVTNPFNWGTPAHEVWNEFFAECLAGEVA